MKSKLKIVSVFSLIILLFGCQVKDPVIPQPPVVDKIYISSVNTDGLIVELYADNSLMVGYNPVYIRVLDSANRSLLYNINLDITPLQDKGATINSAPAENPGLQPNNKGYYEGAVVFLSPSSLGDWVLQIDLTNIQGSIQSSVEFELSVIEPAKKRLLFFESKNTLEKIYLSYVEPHKPGPGLNDYEIVIHKKLNAMNYPAVSFYNIKLDTEMPGTGHSSANNVNPVHSISGHYNGNVNLTLPGIWHINMNLFQNSDTVIGDIFFEIDY